MIVSLIAAMGNNRVIGKENALPWHLPADMQHFRALTRGKPIIMGRKTFESIGKALPGRKNIVLTHNESYTAEGCIVVHTREEALRAAEGSEEAMVIGGGKIYEEFFPIATKMYLTLIDHAFEGDTKFPEFDETAWKKTEEPHEPDQENPYRYTFLTFSKN